MDEHLRQMLSSVVSDSEAKLAESALAGQKFGTFTANFYAGMITAGMPEEMARGFAVDMVRQAVNRS